MAAHQNNNNNNTNSNHDYVGAIQQLHQRQQIMQEQAAEAFSHGVADLFMAVEELRQTIPSVAESTNSATTAATPSITVQLILQWQFSIDHWLQILTHLQRWALDADAAVATTVGGRGNDKDNNAATTTTTTTTTVLVHSHAIQKAIVTAQHVLELCCTVYTEPTEAASAAAIQNNNTSHDATTANDHDNTIGMPLEEQRRNAQGAIARLTEVNLILLDLLRVHNDDNTVVLERSPLQSSAAEFTTSSAKNNIKSASEIIQWYAQYQRQVLRQRAKPAIAQLVQERRQGTFRNEQQPQQQQLTVPGAAVVVQVHKYDENDDDDGQHESQQHWQYDYYQTHHAPILTTILGEAAALIHPLAAWMAHLSPPPFHYRQRHQQQRPSLNDVVYQLCQDSIRTLDEQAQTLAKTVSDWFWQDRPVDAYMQQSSLATAGRTLSIGGGTRDDDVSLARLDALVEEMAYICQIFERYQALIAAVTTTTATLVEEEDVARSTAAEPASAAAATTTTVAILLPEWTWKYCALERFLALQQWQAALAQAVPVTIVLGTEIRVPSVVEDAQYLSTRALERAATTRAFSAVATVAYAICHDVWSTEMCSTDTNVATTPVDATLSSTSTSAVYQALLDERGSWSDAELDLEKNNDSGITLHPPPSSDFASALLGALDDDIGPSQQQHSYQSPTRKPLPSRAPSSGNFLTSLVLAGSDRSQQKQLDTLFCVLNGMHAASGASRYLVTFLDDLIAAEEVDDSDETVSAVTNESQKATSMIKLAREELSRYSDTYQKLLTGRIDESLVKWCGSPSPNAAVAARGGKGALCCRLLQHFFSHENYNLNEYTIGPAEADERLDQELIKPLRDSKFLNQLPDKCEAEVLQITSERVAVIVVDLVLDSLWNDDADGAKKKFTDWGSLLLSKQSRILQTYISTTMVQTSTATPAGPAAASPRLLQIWERLSQVVTVLQLEKPSDWLAYHSTSILTPVELSRTLSLRIDFSTDVIDSVISTVTTASAAHATAKQVT